MRLSPSVVMMAALAGLMLAACGSRGRPAVVNASPSVQVHASSVAVPRASGLLQPSPVSTAATLASKCTTGVEDLTTNVFYPAAEFLTPGTTVPSGDTITGAYQATFTNDSSATAEVTGFAVVFYDGSASETGSGSQDGFDSFITPGQSLTWTEAPWGETVQSAPFAAGQTGAIDVQSTCQVVKWAHP